MATGLTSDRLGILNYKFLITTSMKKFFLIASAFALCLCASAQLDPKSIDLDDTFDFLADLPPLPSAPPHLTPSAPSYIGVVDSYSEIVDDMFELYGRKVQWAFVDRPSFSPEYAVKCIGISGQPYLVAVTASKNIWYNSRPNVEVIGDTLQVSMEQAGQLDALFRLAVETSSFMPYPKHVFTDENGNKTLKGGPVEVVLVDGNSYTFYSEGRTAMCRNQLGEGPLKNLVDIGIALYKAVKAKDLEAVTKVLDRVEPTKQSLFAAAPEWYPEYLEAKTNDLWNLNQ